MNFLAKLLLVVCVLGGLFACTPVYRFHGYVPQAEDLEKIEVGVDTRETVIEKIGAPIASGVSQADGFFYISSKWEHLGARAPKIVSRDIVAISFDQDNLVRNIGRYQLADGEIITLVRRVSEGGAQEVGVIRQILNNLRNFEPSQVIDRP